MVNIGDKISELSPLTGIDGSENIPVQKGNKNYRLPVSVLTGSVSLKIRKVYSSVSAMNEDGTSPVGSDGTPIKAGEIVSIYNSENSQDPDNNSIYSFQNPGWLQTGKLSQVDSELSETSTNPVENKEASRYIKHVSLQGNAVEIQSFIKNGYVAATSGTQYLINYTPNTSMYKCIILPVEEGDIYMMDCGVFSEQLGFYAFSQDGYKKTSYGKLSPVLGINEFPPAPAGAKYMAIQLQWKTQEQQDDYYYKNLIYKKKSVVGRLQQRTNESLQKINDRILYECVYGIINLDDYAINGYVTSSPNKEPILHMGDGKYRTLIVKVTPGQIFEYVYIGNDTAMRLNVFMNKDMNEKVGGNFSVSQGVNIIKVPDGCEYMALTIKFGDDDSSVNKTLKYKANDISNGKRSEIEDILVKKIGNRYYVGTSFDQDNYLVQTFYTRENNNEHNPGFNLDTIYLSRKTNNDITINNSLLKTASDDICPIYVNGSYIGGNHGWNFPLKVRTSSKHGKTISDVGSVYTDTQGVKFYILRVLDENNIIVLSENKGVEGEYDFKDPVGNLSYLQDGYNTQDIIIDSYRIVGNIYNCIKLRNNTILADGNVISDGTYNCRSVAVIESYDILDIEDIVMKLNSNRPIGGYTSDPLLNGFTGTKKLINVSTCYEFKNNGATIVSTTIKSYDKCTLEFAGYVQSQCLVGDDVRLLCPKSLPFEQDGKSWDFSTWQDFSTSPSSQILIKKERYEIPDNPPDRVLQKNNKIIVSLGYITDRGKIVDRKDNIDVAVMLSTQRKMYPYGIYKSLLLNAGDYYNSVSYRCFSDIRLTDANRSSFYWIELGTDIFIYLTYHGEVDDYLPTINSWNGRKIEVVEKNDKVELVSDVVSGFINIKSIASQDEYGFITLRIK